VILRVSGTEYDEFTTASATAQLDAISRSFSFSATSRDGEPLPFRGGEPCQVLVDEEVVLTGFVERVNVDYDSSSHNITVAGRDKTGDVVDSSITDLGDIRPLTLKRVIEQVLENLGSTSKVVDRRNPSPFNVAQDVTAPEIGQNAFEFIEGLARVRQVLLTSDGFGNIVILHPTGTPVAATILHNLNSSDNNVLTSSVSYDFTERFRTYINSSQLNMVPLNQTGTETDPEEIVNKTTPPVTDPGVRVGRQLVIDSESSMFGESEGLDRATWEARIRKTRGQTYSATVTGYRNQAGSIWAPGQVVRVEDVFAGINARMMINSVTYTLSRDGGRSTDIGLVERNAYQLSLEEPRDEEVGGGLAF
jgi:prophage tail gpP-like protein